MAKRKAKECELRANFSCKSAIAVNLTDAEIQDVRTEFVWFFTGQNNAKTLIEQRNLKFLDMLYEKYEGEIRKMREHYGLDEIIGEMDYAQAWFRDWKKMELFTKEQFLDKIRTSEDFALIWADLGITDSIEFRNWGITLQFDANDNASVNKPGKDQLTGIINSIVSDPENGLHCVTLYNPSNIGERSTPVGMLTVQFVCHPMKYEERIRWLFENYYETGMEYEIMLDSLKSEDLDKLKWYDDFIALPKYGISSFATYGRIGSQKDLDQAGVFNTMLLKTIAKFLNMNPINASVHTIRGFGKAKKSKNEDVFIETKIDPSKGLNIQNESIIFRRAGNGRPVPVHTAD